MARKVNKQKREAKVEIRPPFYKIFGWKLM